MPPSPSLLTAIKTRPNSGEAHNLPRLDATVEDRHEFLPPGNCFTCGRMCSPASSDYRSQASSSGCSLMRPSCSFSRTQVHAFPPDAMNPSLFPHEAPLFHYVIKRAPLGRIGSAGSPYRYISGPFQRLWCCFRVTGRSPGRTSSVAASASGSPKMPNAKERPNLNTLGGNNDNT
jgi:hypothetical protein